MGSVRGTVHDQSGAVVPNADVTLTNVGTNVASKGKSNENGIYVFPAIAPGQYHVKMEAAGLQPYQATLTVQVQQSTTADAVLQVGTETTTVVVRDIVPVTSVDTMSLGHVLERRRIEQLPLNGRSITGLLATVPGMEGGQSRAYGTRVGATDYFLDGAAMSDPVDGEGTTIRPPSLDTVQEFAVENNAPSAKFSRPTSVVLTTKSGTNQLHGTLFETNRNNAYGKARSKDDLGSTFPKLIRNEYGGTAGGPVFIPKVYDGRNRTFWFFAYEGNNSRQPGSPSGRVPLEKWRNGDFSQLVNSSGQALTIYDPFSTDANWGRQPFPDNKIPQALESPTAKYAFAQIPMPTNGKNPLVSANWFGPGLNSINQWTITTRFDHNFSDNDKFYARYTQGAYDRISNGNYLPLLDHIANYTRRPENNKSLALSWVRTLTPTFFNEMLVSGSREYADILSGDPSVPYVDQMKLPNPFGVNGFPVLAQFGLTPTSYFMPANRRTRWLTYYIFEDNATKIAGKHELQFGAHLRKDFWNLLPQQTQAAGYVSFNTLATGLWNGLSKTSPAAVGTSNFNLANLFLGVANYSNNLRKGTWYERRNEDAFYFQDNYKVSQRMTLRLGLRWEMNPAMYDKYNTAVSYDPTQRAYVLGQSLENMYKRGSTVKSLVDRLTTLTGAKFITYDQAGLPKKLVNDNWFDLGPSVGFSYRALDGPKSFVVRAGFATKFYPENTANWNDPMTGNTPFAANYTNSSTAADQSPDGISNYSLRSRPTIIAGENSQNAITLADPRGLNRTSGVITYFNPDYPTSRVHSWNFTLEKEVLPETLLRIGYIGQHQSHDSEGYPMSQQTPSNVWYMTKGVAEPTGADASILMTPYNVGPDGNALPTVFGNVQEFRKTGYAWMSGAQVEFERRYSKGFAYQLQYVMLNLNRLGQGFGGYGSSVNDINQYLPGTVPTDLATRHKLLDYHRESDTPQHRIRWNWLLDLPFGKGKLLAGNAHGFIQKIIGGWQLSGIGSLQSNYISLTTNGMPTGQPVEIYGTKYPIQDCRSTGDSGPALCTPGYLWYNGYMNPSQINSHRDDGTPNGIMGVPDNYKPSWSWLVPEGATSIPNAPANINVEDFWYSDTMFVTMKDGSKQETSLPNNYHPWSNVVQRGPFTWGLDAGLVKNFAITERVNLRFNMDAFNVLNHPGLPSWIDGDTGIMDTTGGSNGGREIQLSLRLSW